MRIPAQIREVEQATDAVVAVTILYESKTESIVLPDLAVGFAAARPQRPTKGDSMKYLLLLTLTLALSACSESAGIYSIEFTTVYSDHYVLAVHAQGSRLDYLEYRAAGDSSSRMPFTTFFRYDSIGLAEIYTTDREGNRTLNYQANSKDIWPLVFIATIQEDFEKDGRIDLATVLYDSGTHKLVLVNDRRGTIHRSDAGITYMADQISRRGSTVEIYYTLKSGKRSLLTYTFDRRLSRILDIR